MEGVEKTSWLCTRCLTWMRWEDWNHLQISAARKSKDWKKGALLHIHHSDWYWSSDQTQSNNSNKSTSAHLVLIYFSYFLILLADVAEDTFHVKEKLEPQLNKVGFDLSAAFHKDITTICKKKEKLSYWQVVAKNNNKTHSAHILYNC